MSWNYATGESYTEVVDAPAGSAISLSDAKEWMKVTTSADDTLIQSIIDAVEAYASGITKRTLQETQFKTYRDVFGDVSDNPAFAGYPAWTVYQYQDTAPITLKKSPFVSIDLVRYYSSGVLTTLNSANYYAVKKGDYSRIAPIYGTYWPVSDQRMQAVEITFTAGYTVLPADLRIAMLDHILSMYENRGDCGCADAAPSNAMAIYRKYTILDFVA